MNTTPSKAKYPVNHSSLYLNVNAPILVPIKTRATIKNPMLKAFACSVKIKRYTEIPNSAKAYKNTKKLKKINV
jgi:hypothetical protein